MNNDCIFTQFCKYVDETIFSDEKKGEVVAFIVDQTYIDDFCKNHHTTESELLHRARAYLHRITSNSLYIKGMIAIQIFAATKRANSDGITERNYRDRLADLIFYDTGELQRWMGDYQDSMWRSFYNWCDSNNFRVSRRCVPFPGLGRYVQYPLQEALRVFTAEALLNFARAFVDNKLTPEDDISYKTFWEIISWRELGKYVDSVNARRIYLGYEYRDDAKQQIYNFFLRWDGEYRVANNSEKKRRVTSNGNTLYLSQDLDCVDVRDANNKLVTSYPVSSLQYRTLTNSSNRIAASNQGVFLFKLDKDYQVWEGTRFVESGEEGIAMVFPESPIAYGFRNCELLLQCPKVKLYKITEETAPEFCFTERKTCYLEGGLKVGRNQYFVGGAPFLVREELEQVRVDKEPIRGDDIRINLSYLAAGTHTISVPGRKSIKFELVEPEVGMMEWNIKFAKWDIAKKEGHWYSSRIEEGVSGMDFTAICQSKYMQRAEESTLKAWAEIYAGRDVQSHNKVVRTIKNIRDYGEL